MYFKTRGLFFDSQYILKGLPKDSKIWDLESDPSGVESDAYYDAWNGVINLWEKNKEKKLDYEKLSEDELLDIWIKPILNLLGWEDCYRYNPRFVKISDQRIRPDLSFFVSDEKLQKSRNAENLFDQSVALGDAKAWGEPLDGKYEGDLLTYLAFTGKDWGILTNGRLWRIYYFRHDVRKAQYYEVDLEKIISTYETGEDTFTDTFKYFYLFFRKKAFEGQQNSFLSVLTERGRFYSVEINEKLKKDVDDVVGEILNGFTENKNITSGKDIDKYYEHSVFYLFRLIFILNLESKEILSLRNNKYYKEYSLKRKCKEILEELKMGDEWGEGCSVYKHIEKLFDVLKFGDKTIDIGLQGFNGSVFSSGDKEFYKKNKLSDRSLKKILSFLYWKDQKPIDYKMLEEDHIGDIFESLLTKRPVIEGGSFKLVTDRMKKKKAGSYYTPTYVVDYIVEQTLEGHIKENASVKDILSLNICEMSLGSGHFCLGVIKYLSQKIRGIDNYEKSIQDSEVEEKILYKCIYGVDIEPIAVELAKMSLYIHISEKSLVSGNRKLQSLDENIKCNDSLTMNWKSAFPKKVPFDTILGNPPYIGEKKNKHLFDEAKKENPKLKKYYQGKMDYFYFFFHLGLDLLKSGGYLGFITTSSFRTADGGKTLREDLRDRSHVKSILDLDDLTIFKGTGQQNQITVLKKTESKNKGESLIIRATGSDHCDEALFNKIVNLNKSSCFYLKKSHENLFEGKNCEIKISVECSVIKKLKELEAQLGEHCKIEAGIQSGADSLTDAHIKEHKIKGIKGDGIYVLSKKEALKKGFLGMEKTKPVFKNSDIEPYKTESENKKFLLYIDGKKCDESVKKHLKKYKSILEKRQGCGKRSYLWFNLHRSRKQEMFIREKIICPYRAKVNAFGYNNCEWFALSDVVYLTSFDQVNSVKSILGYLNSKTIYYWLYKEGRRKGSVLELCPRPLKEIPTPKFSKDDQKKIELSVNKLLKNNNLTIEKEKIDGIIYKTLGLSKDEIEMVEDFCKEKIKEAV